MEVMVNTGIGSLPYIIFLFEYILRLVLIGFVAQLALSIE